MGSTRVQNFNNSRNTVAKAFNKSLFAEEIRNFLTSMLIWNESPSYKMMIGIVQIWNLPLLQYHVTFYNGKSCSNLSANQVFWGPYALHTLFKEPIHHPSNKSPGIFLPIESENQPQERSTWRDANSGELLSCWFLEQFVMRMSNSTKSAGNW